MRRIRARRRVEDQWPLRRRSLSPPRGERPTRPKAERVRGCRRRSARVDSPSPSPFGLASCPRHEALSPQAGRGVAARFGPRHMAPQRRSAPWFLSAFPLVAILRGLRPDDAVAIGEALVEGGFRIIEVPLNAPEPLRSIEVLAKRFGPEVLVGAGTVLDPADVDRVRDAGGRLVVMPHGDAAVIARAVAAGLACTPGVATPTEAFAALKCGAAGLKMFPAENLPPVVVKAWRAVVPKDTLLLPVGGINPDNMAPYVEAGADGFGLGSALFSAGAPPATVRDNARRFAVAWELIRARKAA